MLHFNFIVDISHLREEKRSGESLSSSAALAREDLQHTSAEKILSRADLRLTDSDRRIYSLLLIIRLEH
jgi:hypothetical protein